MTQNGTSLWQKPQADGIRPLPTGPQAPWSERNTLSKNRRKDEERREKVDEKKRKRPPVPNWCHWPCPKLNSAHIQAEKQQQQVRTDSRQWREGRGRAGQGNVQRLVVVVVAASETVRLSWLAFLTVDSLSLVDLTSQGFFHIPARGSLHLCVSAHMCAQKKEKRKKKVSVFMCVFHVWVTQPWENRSVPWGIPQFFSWPFSHLTEALLSVSSTSLSHSLSASDRFPSQHLWPSLQSSQTSRRLLHPLSVFLCV